MMDFSLTEEQQMIRDSARRFLEKECSFELRPQVITSGAFSPAHWRQYADMGWLGLALPEAHGGLGGHAVDMTLLMEEAGRTLLVEPLWAVAVLAAQTLLAINDEVATADLLPALIAGEALPVLAHGEEESRGVLEHVSTNARRNSQGEWVLNGVKSLAVGGNIADRYIVSARTAGGRHDRDGISLFLLPVDCASLEKTDVRLIDNRWAAHLSLKDVTLPASALLGQAGKAYAALEAGHAHGLLALCAEAIGVMEKALWLTRDYLLIRKQFRTTLSSFQSLQHRMSEMLIELELSRSMLYRALSEFDNGPEARQHALSAAKAHIGRSGLFICGQAIQLHGGIGVTEEYVIGHHFKRMTLIEHAFGSSHHHFEKLADLERKGLRITAAARHNAA